MLPLMRTVTSLVPMVRQCICDYQGSYNILSAISVILLLCSGMKPSPNKYHKPTSNGCGPVGMEVSAVFFF